VKGLWEHGGRTVLLLDTGGIRAQAAGIDALVSQRSREAFTRAQIIILLLDVREITPEDEELIACLRPYAPRVIAAVNKVDTENHEDAVGEFRTLGFRQVFAVSAAHGRSCDELADAVFSGIDFSLYEEEGEPGREAAREEITLAILGKPNTGKSTLVNRLLGEELSIVSEVPGTTRDILEGGITFRGKNFRLLDTAGIRRKSHVTESVEYYSVNRAIAAIEDADVALLLIDAAEGLAEQDKKIAAQIVKKGRGIILGLNKWDLMPRNKKALAAAAEKLRFQFPVLDFAPVMAVSARTGWNLDELLVKAREIDAQLQRRIETAALNRALEAWVSENPPPRDGRRQYKIRFITQVSIKPIRFILFVNKKDGFPLSYLGYVKNKIRGLGFQDVPFAMDLRTRETDP
jgi:GTP-binding protein